MHKLLTISLLALVAACGGGGGDGGGGGGGGGGGAPNTAIAPSKMFVADAAHAAIGSSPNSNPSSGTFFMERVIMGPNTMLSSSLVDIAIDVARDRLYVADLRSILVFENVSTANGNVTPHLVSSCGSCLGYNGIAYDAVNNRLYASANQGGMTQSVEVFDSVSALTVSPSRTFTFNSNYIFDLAIDPIKDLLYAYHVNNSGVTEIAVFGGAASITPTPGSTIDLTDPDPRSTGPAVGMFVDSDHDRLYAPRSGQILVFDNASTKNGSVAGAAAPERTITLPVNDFTNVTVDVTADRLYAADNAGLTIIANASTAGPTPTTAIRGVPLAGGVFKAVAVKP